MIIENDIRDFSISLANENEKYIEMIFFFLKRRILTAFEVGDAPDAGGALPVA
jgi:hypothetical protein